MSRLCRGLRITAIFDNFFLVLAIFFIASVKGPFLGNFPDQIKGAAIGAGFVNRQSPGYKVAVRITAAAVEHSTAFGLPFGDLAAATGSGAGNVELLRFDIPAFRVTCAGNEGTEPSGTANQVGTALGTFLFEGGSLGHLGFSLAVYEYLFGVLAFRVTGTGQKLAVSAPPGHHFSAAFLTDFAGIDRLRFR